MPDRTVPPEVVILPGTDIDGEWERFEVFEALHHGMHICNPMTSEHLDALIDALGPTAGDRMLDIACGHGELLIRAAERATVRAVGVDLSPWALVRALETTKQRTTIGTVEWLLGDAKRAGREERYDIVTCLGASWIWHGFLGTARAVADRSVPGGRVAIGDLRLAEDVDPAAFADAHGSFPTLEAQAQMLESAGIEVVDRIESGLTGWDAYQDRIMRSVEAWQRAHPGPRSDGYVAEQRRWQQDHLRDREFLRWTVWVGRVES